MERARHAEIYFAYGSNMSSERLHERIPRATPLGRARWRGMRLAFNKPGRDGSGKANLVADANSDAWGVLYTIPSSEWLRLDEFEPGYARFVREVTLDSGETSAAQVYLGVGETRELPPHDWYRDHLLRGAVEHGLPGEIVRMIERLQRGCTR